MGLPDNIYLSECCTSLMSLLKAETHLHRCSLSYRLSPRLVFQEACLIKAPTVADPQASCAHRKFLVFSVAKPCLSNTMDGLGLQTGAANQRTPPNNQPAQGVTASHPATLPDFARCSRCQRSLSIGNAAPSWDGAVRIGINSYYCSRCAAMVGYKR